MNLPSTPAKLWTERYESLRHHFLNGRRLLGTEPVGLTLLLHQGLASWMRAWQTDGGAESVAPASPSPSWTAPVGPVWQQEVTRLIAQMTAYQL